MKDKQKNNISPIRKYKNLYVACQQYPEIQLQPNDKPLIVAPSKYNKKTINNAIKSLIIKK